MFQGTLLIDFDVERMLRVLRIPAEKLSDKAIASAKERVVNLKELLGELPSFETVKAKLVEAFAEEFDAGFETADELLAREQEIFEEALAEIDTEEWVFQHNRPVDTAPQLESLHKSAGGLMRASVLVDEDKQRLKQVWITGDFFVTPPRTVFDLEARLQGSRLEEIDDVVDAFFESSDIDMLSVTADDFKSSIANALSSHGANGG